MGREICRSYSSIGSEVMIFKETVLKGCYLIELEKISDSRGEFSRSFCTEEFRSHGLNPTILQCNTSFNYRKGTVRGMHFQQAPKAEVKLVRCTKGAIYDVVLDLRPDSTTYCQWVGVELREDNGKMLYIPEGFAHGFQSLEDNTEVFYQMSESYSAQHSAGVRWNDSRFGIEFPLDITCISEKDLNYSDFLP